MKFYQLNVTRYHCDEVFFVWIFANCDQKKSVTATKRNPVKTQQVSANSQSMKCDETERAHIQSIVQNVPDTCEREDKKTVLQLQCFPNKGLL